VEVLAVLGPHQKPGSRQHIEGGLADIERQAPEPAALRAVNLRPGIST
jgi:hypothetical protein